MPKVNDQPPSLRCAARTIGVSMPTLYRLISEGKLRSYHVGRAHRVSEDAIRDWASPEIPDLNQGRLRGRSERRLKLIWRPVADARV
jgi:excisionase family DNA binding protein